MKRGRFGQCGSIIDKGPQRLHCHYMQPRPSTLGFSADRFSCWLLGMNLPLARLRCLPRAAFTLIELLVVVAIIAILAGLTLSTLGYVNKKGAQSRAQAEVAALSAAIESYKLDFGGYPASTNVLYRELVGAGAINTNKVFFEPTPGILTTNGGTVFFTDPWGAVYNYDATNATFNVGFFDLWSTAGEPTSGGNTNNWIRN